MVITGVFLSFEDKSGVWNPSTPTPSSKNYQSGPLPRMSFYSAKSSTREFIPLYPGTILTIVSIGPGFIKVGNRASLLTVPHHLSEIGVPVLTNST
jgi:hypothetical protein